MDSLESTTNSRLNHTELDSNKLAMALFADTQKQINIEPGKIEAGNREAGKNEAGNHDTGKNESGLHESGLHESGLHESGIHESGIHESGIHESGIHESGIHESGIHESGKREAEHKSTEENALKKYPPIITSDSNGHVQKIVRADGSEDSFQYDGDSLSRYTSKSSSGEVTTWERQTKNSETDSDSSTKRHDDDKNLVRWTSPQSDDMLINIRVQPDATVVYEDVPGAIITKRPDAWTQRENINGTKVLLDEKSRVIHLEKSDGSTVDANYKNETPIELSIQENGVTTEWSRDAKGKWTNPHNELALTHYKLSETGVETCVETLHGNVTHIEYPDGANRSFVHSNGRLDKVIEHSVEQHRDIAWTRVGNSDMWKSAGLAEKRMAAQVSADGNYSYVDTNGLMHKFTLDESEVLSRPGRKLSADALHAGESLKDAAQLAISDPAQLKEFDKDISKFELRAQAQDLDDKVIASSLMGMAALLDTNKSSYLPASDRIDIAEQAMHNLATPRSTDQGGHNTCGATSAEVLLSAKYPDRLVDLLNQIADTGEYKTAKGLVIKPSAQSLKADKEASSFDPYDADASEGVRSFVGQLVQTVGIDAIYSAQNLGRFYESKDDKEYVVNSGSGKIHSFDGLEDPDVHEMLRQITAEEISPYSKEKQFNSAETLKDVLQGLQKDHAFPIVFSVDVLKKGGPFFEQYREDRAGLDDGGHYVTVWDIDSHNNVLVDDQFGHENDFESLRRVPVEKLFKATTTFRSAPARPDPIRIVHHRHMGQ